MRKLVSVSIILALLVTFVVPVVVAAQDECCGYTPPEATPLPDRNTKTLAGGVMWTLLGVSDIMGKAVCATTGMMAGNLGGWSDQLGVIAVGVTAKALSGVGDLLAAVIKAFLPDYETLGTAVAEFLKGIADALEGAAGA